MTGTNFSLILAKKEEYMIAITLLKKVSKDLEHRKINQWAYWQNPSQDKINWVKEGFNNQEFYLIKDELNKVLGMVRLSTEDKLYWGEQSEKAIYIHSLVIDPLYTGKKIGSSVLQEIESQTLLKGVHYLRLDCVAGNTDLCQYYEKHGFLRIGSKQMPLSLNSLYQKEI